LQGEYVRTEGEIAELKAERGGWWRVIRAIRRRRPVLTALLVLAAPAHALWSATPPVDLLRPTASDRAVAAWLLMLLAVGTRLWGAGNLRKNEDITDAGIYRLVRHPLYLGSLSFFLAYFLTVGDPAVGIFLFLVLLGLVFYPTMLGEEEHLSLKFPTQFGSYRPPPRLLPDPRRLREAIRTDRFEAGAARRNLGFRGVWFLVGLPLFLRGIAWLQRTVAG
jgi:protein-S-isoprenylcysteine O-methyltransferase Ste14